MATTDTISHIVSPINERNEFLRSLKNGQILIVKAYANWCGPCKKIAPLVDKLLNRMPKNVKMMYLDVDTGRDLTNYLKITSVPTFISYVNKEKMDILTSSSEDDVRKFFRKIEAYNLLK